MKLCIKLDIGRYFFEYDEDIDNSVLMTVFRESDKYLYFEPDNWQNEYYANSDYRFEYVYCYYSQSAKVVKQRLEILGFTMANIKHRFFEEYPKYIERLRKENENGYKKDNEKEDRNKLLDCLEKMSFDDWFNTFREMYTNDIHTYTDIAKYNSNLIIRYIAEFDMEHTLYKYPYNDMREVLRIFMEFCNDDTCIKFDYSELIEDRTIEPSYNLCEKVISNLVEGYPVNEKIIILTEGSKDTEYIKKSMKLLYPHLYEYYSFMDFHSINVQGGVDSLVKLLKAFISLGISNRVIAILDNDTAAEVATRNFNIDRMPDNFKILKLPYLYFAKSYPTLGPNGTSYQDINGLACSIELFFGDDVLKEEEEYVPIQWKGYDENLHRYQGEITKKNLMQNKFEEKLKKCFKSPGLINQFDWEPMDLLLYEIFDAFK